MKNFFAIGIVIILGLLWGCGLKTPNSNTPKNNLVSHNEVENIRWNDTISLPFSAPHANEYIMYDSGAIECKGSEKKDIFDYFEILKKDGWNIVEKPFSSNSLDSVFIKGNDTVTILDQTFISSSPSDENNIRITYLAGYHGNYDDGRITPIKTKPIIQTYLNSLPQDECFNGQLITGITEFDLGEVYVKMGLQGFRIYGAANFSAQFILGTNNALSLVSATEFCTADIDNDGEYEFITIAGSGSGIYRIDLNAYKYNKNGNAFDLAYSNCWIPKAGFAELTIVKVDDKTVNLYGAEMKMGKLIPTEDYGQLKISEKLLSPQNGEMPFEEWGS